MMLQDHDKVEGVIMINNEGIPLKSTIDDQDTVQVRGGIT